MDGRTAARHDVATMEFEFCRVCGQTNPLDQPACALCGRTSWRSLAGGTTGLLDAMNRVEEAVGRARGVRDTATDLRTRRSA